MRDLNAIEQNLIRTGRWGAPTPKVAENAKYCCEYCDLDLLASLENYKLWSMDHIIPLHAGGPDIASNLALACWNCNGHLKGRWNPDPNKTANSRQELIERVRAYLNDVVRPQRENILQEARDIIGWNDGKLADPHPPAA